MEEALAGSLYVLGTRILCSDIKNEDYPIVAAVLDDEDYEEVVSYTKEGKYLKKSGTDDWDLFMKDKEYWVNLYKMENSPIDVIGYAKHSSREEALKNIGAKGVCGRYLDTVKVVEHGEN